MFLNITPPITHRTNPHEFILTLDENPLTEFVELPDDAMGKKLSKQHDNNNQEQSTKTENGANNNTESNADEDEEENSEGLWYSNVLCGVLRGALEMVCLEIFNTNNANENLNFLFSLPQRLITK